MNVLVERADSRAARAYTESGREAASYHASKSQQVTETGGFILDISGTAMNNRAYADHGRTVEDVIQEAGAEDITARRNYMAIMSNAVSDEDFARLQREGFHPGSTDIETVVTIVDRMKAALSMGGTEIAGYTDTVSDDALKEITGSETFANELKKQFSEKNLPLTEENIAAVTEAWNILNQAGEPTDGSMKYMIENELEPTPENLYTARYSASADGSRQGRGYYEAGSVAGYYARKPDEIDFEKLRPQMEKIIEDAGYTADKESLEDAKWLVEKGIPLNTETFSLLNEIKQHSFPVKIEDFMLMASSALADGILPEKTSLGRTESYREQAAALMKETAAVDEKAADLILARDIPLTLKNLLAVQKEMLSYAGKGREEIYAENIHGRRLLEEVRLSMTIEANLKLLRSGFQIETAPLEELVSGLKEAENNLASTFTGEPEIVRAQEKASLYQETIEVVAGIQSSPVSIVAQINETDTLREVYAHGRGEKRACEKAGQSYEAMMTQPRRDMGDSIQKAFRNVDDILESMGLETSEANRRAVRILGYNSLEITAENISQIRKKDELLGSVVREMKPGRVLDMIREGMNPLVMSLEELENYFDRQEGENPAEQMESYSRFLYKLEKQKGISQEEKSAYIGIYRLVRQLEKTDDAAVGALWQMGSDFTLGNLLKALRSSKRGSMDYSVDDKFGGVGVRQSGKESITDQIARGYTSQELPSGQELEQILEDAGSEEAGREFDSMLYEEIRTAVKSEEEILRHLTDYGETVTADHLLAAGTLLKNPKEIWRELNRMKEQKEDFEEIPAGERKSLEEMGEEFVKSLENKEDAGKAYEDLQETLQGIIERMAFSDSAKALDVRAMSTLYKQISFMGSMAREENYEIPANIGGSLTSINLKIIHKGQKESKVAIAFEAVGFGTTTAEFKLTGHGLEGYCTCSSPEGAGLLNEYKQFLEEKLEKEQVLAGRIYFAAKENLDLKEFSLKESDGRQSGDHSKLLYRAARAFIEYVQETGLKKGN